jgi:hypothetical protein
MTLPADWIYLFTSNARALYSVDALNALGLPRGWVLHYRYDKKHVEERLWESLVSKADTPGALKGKQLVVSLVNQKQVKSDDKVSFEASEYFPLRTGELVEYRIDGRVVHFWFALQAYLRYERSGQADGLPWQVQNRVQAACGEKTALLGVYATWGNPEPFAGVGVVSDADATSGFQSTVEAISDHGFRSGSTIFARFHGVTERTPGPIQTDRVVAIGYAEGTQESKYVLEEGKTYRLAVTIYSEKFLSLPTFADAALELRFDSSLFIALDRDRIPIAGRVDMPSFLVATRKVAETQVTFLRIYSAPGITRKETTEAATSELLDEFRGCDWTIPVEVQTNKKAKLFRIIQRSGAETLVALFTLAAASIFARYITGDPSKPIAWWVVPSIIGSLFLIAVGIWLRITLDETK